jgi:hypothetical protein
MKLAGLAQAVSSCAFAILSVACESTASAVPDAAIIVIPVFDAGITPTGDLTSPAADAGKAPPPLVCPPSPASFTPKAYVPSVAHQGLCTTAEVDAFTTACLDPGTSCGAWVNANVAGSVDGGVGTSCGNCIEAPLDLNNGGVWLDPEGFFGPNYGGCMQLLDPTSGPACAAAFNNDDGCQALACDYCPGSPNEFSACYNAAVDAGCASYAAAEGTGCENDFNNGVYGQCSASNGGTQDYVFSVTLICGAASVDAGATPDGAARDAAEE